MLRTCWAEDLAIYKTVTAPAIGIVMRHGRTLHAARIRHRGREFAGLPD